MQLSPGILPRVFAVVRTIPAPLHSWCKDLNLLRQLPRTEFDFSRIGRLQRKKLGECSQDDGERFGDISMAGLHDEWVGTAAAKMGFDQFLAGHLQKLQSMTYGYLLVFPIL